MAERTGLPDIRSAPERSSSASPPSSPPSSCSSVSFSSSLSNLLGSVHHQILRVRLEEELLVRLAVGDAEPRMYNESIDFYLGPSPLGLQN